MASPVMCPIQYCSGPGYCSQKLEQEYQQFNLPLNLSREFCSMNFASHISILAESIEAIDEVCQQVIEDLAGTAPNLAFVFVTHPHRAEFESLAEIIQSKLGCQVLLGCAAESVAGNELEIEVEPAISLWAGHLQGATFEPFHIQFRRTADGIVCDGLPDVEEGSESSTRAIFLLGDPYTSQIELVFDHFAEVLPGVPILGGMASGARRPGENRLFFNGECLDEGSVGVIVRGGPKIKSIVSQGCRQIGHPFIVTKADANQILELGGKPAIVRLSETWREINGEDQRLVRQGLHVGIVMNEYKEKFQNGDFLIANMLGVDQESGMLVIGNTVRVGQTIQFHVRDAKSADEELHQMLKRETSQNKPAAALLFSCNGRGTRLFEEQHHDATAIQTDCGPLPLAGFFAQGELGPVGNKNYIHGFTASVVLFEEQQAASSRSTESP